VEEEEGGAEAVDNTISADNGTDTA